MTGPGVVRIDASPISVVAARARAAQPPAPSPDDPPFDALSREGFERIDAAGQARALPRRTWLILVAGLVAWAVVAIPAWIVFG